MERNPLPGGLFFWNHQKKSVLELIVKVFNISNPTAQKNLNILNKCVILKQYCDYVDIIRRYYRKGSKETFDIAIRECLKKGILGEYLVQAAKGRFNMLFTDYDYDTDIRVQREESFEAGQKKKAEEDALNFLKEGISPEIISKCTGLLLEKVKEMEESLKKTI